VAFHRANRAEGGGRVVARPSMEDMVWDALGLNAEGPGGEGMGRLAWEGDGWGVGYGTEPLEDALGEDIQIRGGGQRRQEGTKHESGIPHALR